MIICFPHMVNPILCNMFPPYWLPSIFMWLSPINISLNQETCCSPYGKSYFWWQRFRSYTSKIPTCPCLYQTLFWGFLLLATALACGCNGNHGNTNVIGIGHHVMQTCSVILLGSCGSRMVDKDDDYIEVRDWTQVIPNGQCVWGRREGESSWWFSSFETPLIGFPWKGMIWAIFFYPKMCLSMATLALILY